MLRFPPPRPVIALRPDQVHLLRIDIDSLPVPEGQLTTTLSPAERERAERFRRPRDAYRFSVAWGALRAVLGQVLGLDPADVSFSFSERGKPYVEGGPAFNLSRSGRWIFIGLTPDGRLGVDIEAVRPISDLAALARSTFAPDEVAELEALPAADRLPAFFALWTRKEALAKALGLGLGMDFTSFAVRASSESGSLLYRFDDPSEDLAAWTVRDVRAPEGAAAAVALDSPEATVEISFHPWPAKVPRNAHRP